MRKTLRDHGLSLTMGGLFLLCLLGHSLAGYDDIPPINTPTSNLRWGTADIYQ